MTVGFHQLNDVRAPLGYHFELLCRIDEDPDELYVDVYMVKDGIVLQDAIKDAAKVWIKAPDGNHHLQDNNGYFNWGDALYIPRSTSEQHGFYWVMPLDYAQNAVNQNENLISS